MMRARYGTGVFLKLNNADLYASINKSNGLLEIPYGVSRIRSFSFFDFDSITSGFISDTVSVIETSAFACCYNLSNVTIGKKVKSIENQAFSHCYSLASIEIPDNVIYIGKEAFRSCCKLSSVVIGNGVTFIDRFAFYKCHNVILHVKKRSFAEWYANKNGLNFRYIK